MIFQVVHCMRLICVQGPFFIPPKGEGRGGACNSGLRTGVSDPEFAQICRVRLEEVHLPILRRRLVILCKRRFAGVGRTSVGSWEALLATSAFPGTDAQANGSFGMQGSCYVKLKGTADWQQRGRREDSDQHGHRSHVADRV